MKFNVIITKNPTEVNRGEANDLRTTFEMEGDLDTVKTYLKLAIPNDFKWGAVERIDEMESGDVSRWMIHKNFTTKELSLQVFSFHDVDPEININAMQNGTNQDPNADPNFRSINKLLGGGKF